MSTYMLSATATHPAAFAASCRAKATAAAGAITATLMLMLSAQVARADSVAPTVTVNPALVSIDLSRANAMGTRTDGDPLTFPLEATADGFLVRLSNFSFDNKAVGDRKADRFNARAAVPFEAPRGKYPSFIRGEAHFTVSKSNLSDLSAALRVGALGSGETAQLKWPAGASVADEARMLTQNIDLTDRQNELRERFCGSAAPVGIITLDFVLSAQRDDTTATYLIQPLATSVPVGTLDVKFSSGELRSCAE